MNKSPQLLSVTNKIHSFALNKNDSGMKGNDNYIRFDWAMKRFVVP